MVGSSCIGQSFVLINWTIFFLSYCFIWRYYIVSFVFWNGNGAIFL